MLYVSFRNQMERDEFYDKTLEQDRVKLTYTEPESMTLKWQNGIISNYEYLLYLNRLVSERNFQMHYRVKFYFDFFLLFWAQFI